MDIELFSERLELSNESIDISWDEGEMLKFIFRMFSSTTVHKGLLKSVGYCIPVLLTCNCSPHIEFSECLIGPALDPVLDIWSFDEA